MPTDKISELAYYYALYNQIAHWAAFVATMGLLINSGIYAQRFQGTDARKEA
jgi:hypothetical protein